MFSNRRSRNFWIFLPPTRGRACALKAFSPLFTMMPRPRCSRQGQMLKISSAQPSSHHDVTCALTHGATTKHTWWNDIEKERWWPNFQRNGGNNGKRCRVKGRARGSVKGKKRMWTVISHAYLVVTHENLLILCAWIQNNIANFRLACYNAKPNTIAKWMRYWQKPWSITCKCPVQSGSHESTK